MVDWLEKLLAYFEAAQAIRLYMLCISSFGISL